MKRIIIFTVLLMVGQTMLIAQKPKEKDIKESNVPVRYVKDFYSKATNVQNVKWTVAEDSSAYTATFTNEDGYRQDYHFMTNNIVETRYYIDPEAYPHAIKDTIHSQYPGHHISLLYLSNTKGKMVYKVRIAKKKCFLSTKEKEVKLLSFETTGKMIEAVDEK